LLIEVCMQQKQRPVPSIRRPTRLIKYPPAPHREHDYAGLNDVTGVATQPTVAWQPPSPRATTRVAPTMLRSGWRKPSIVGATLVVALRGLRDSVCFSKSPTAKVTLGLLIGIGLLCLASRFVDIPAIMQVLRENLATPRGIILG